MSRCRRRSPPPPPLTPAAQRYLIVQHNRPDFFAEYGEDDEEPDHDAAMRNLRLLVATGATADDLEAAIASTEWQTEILSRKIDADLRILRARQAIDPQNTLPIAEVIAEGIARGIRDREELAVLDVADPLDW